MCITTGRQEEDIGKKRSQLEFDKNDMRLMDYLSASVLSWALPNTAKKLLLTFWVNISSKGLWIVHKSARNWKYTFHKEDIYTKKKSETVRLKMNVQNSNHS